MIKRLIYWLGLLFIIFIISFFPAKASLEFQTDYRIIYQIGPRGNAKVSQEITLTNKFSNIYPKEYYFQINNTEIQNITAEDELGNILNQVTKEGGTTKIKLLFNQKVAGKGKSLSFRISYLLPRFAIKKGVVWELTIPSLSNLSEIDSLTLTIKTPLSFGNLSYASIHPREQKIQGEFQIFNYQKKQLNQGPLVLAFGEFQIFNFSLDFFLENPKEERVKTEIPLPPDTPYQSVFFTQIEPQPNKIRTDQDLNWLAEYYLEPKENKTIRVEGQAKIFSRAENSPLLKIFRQQDRSIYLNQDQFWEVGHPLIKNLARQYNTPAKIYQLVVETLDYDYQNLTNARRQGALQAYKTKVGVCTEFSDLFITLARAAGIPARELQGFAFTNNQELISLSSANDVLHSWAEYWDDSTQAWVPVDPTWAKTTRGMDFINNFDLGHFVFVIHGQSSTQPLPPGSYQFRDKRRKTVRVEFANKLLPAPKTEFKPRFNLQDKAPKIVVKNTSLAPAYNIKILLLGWKEKSERKIQIDYLPPLGERELTIDRPSLFSLIFGRPIYSLTINKTEFKLQYPKPKLNLKIFFDKLLGR